MLSANNLNLRKQLTVWKSLINKKKVHGPFFETCGTQCVDGAEKKLKIVKLHAIRKINLKPYQSNAPKSVLLEFFQ